MRPIDYTIMRVDNALKATKPQDVMRFGQEALWEIAADYPYLDKKNRAAAKELQQRIRMSMASARPKLSRWDRWGLKLNPPQSPFECPWA